MLPAVANRDMSCIVNSTVGYGLGCVAPVKLTGINPKVVPIRPRTYHGAGLYPFLDRTAYYVVPSVFVRIYYIYYLIRSNAADRQCTADG